MANRFHRRTGAIVRARSYGLAHTLMSVREHRRDERTDSGEFVGPDGSRATCCIAIVRALDLGHGHGTTDARRGCTCELAPAPLPAPPAAQQQRGGMRPRFLNFLELLNENHQANLWFTCGSPLVHQPLVSKGKLCVTQHERTFGPKDPTPLASFKTTTVYFEL